MREVKRPASPQHIAEVLPRERGVLPGEDLDALLRASGYDSGAFLSNGKAFGVAGAFPLWPGVAFAWALVDQEVSARDMAFMTRRLREWLDNCNYHRVQSSVRVEFEPGHRWVERLGFELEGLARKYGSDGSDHVLWARVK